MKAQWLKMKKNIHRTSIKKNDKYTKFKHMPIKKPVNNPPRNKQKPRNISFTILVITKNAKANAALRPKPPVRTGTQGPGGEK